MLDAKAVKMMLVYYLIPAVIVAIVAILVLSITIIAYKCSSKRRQKSNQLTQEAATPPTTPLKETTKTKNGTYKRIGIDLYDTASELEGSEEDEIGYLSEAESAKMAAKSTGNLLRTNTGKVW